SRKRAPRSDRGAEHRPTDDSERPVQKDDAVSLRERALPGDEDASGDESKRKSGDGNQGRNDKQTDDGKEKRRAFLRRPAVMITGAVLLFAIIAGVLLWWLQARKYETTDDAFIDAHIVRVSAQIAGQLTAIHVQDNQLVHEGEQLVEIDSSQ